ncbi:GIY-YIG nuclease family protein [candidate division WOR-3 bacterium]|uniref:GIY-YIG nuclease family protein n=1 Tax=candidate division WOR-3 bacterium TaxID=2052148 RepID=A0A9D5K9L6_UNCW3|nr:GIY-YIG nuclease family protein [candidate division WOR-3 bacterium]MBD3364957.1 GIY-YIG nuclease family protein [candidate division WOR-3 bacterium]
MPAFKGWYVYILKCADGSFYTGIARDVLKRLAKHNAGKGARYTRSRRPCLLRFMERHATRSSALKREAEIKGLNPEQKRALCNSCPAY